MKKFKFLILLTILSLSIVLVACSGDADNPETSSNDESGELVVDELGELTVGLMASIDAFPIVIAHYHGFFEEEGLTVNLEPFSSAGDRDAALQAGLLDGATVDLVAVGLSQEAGIVPLRATGSTSGRFTLVANEGMYSIEDLEGEYVVISYNTAIHFVLDQMINIAGFEDDHITREVIPSIPARLESLRAGQVSAALLPEPWATIATAEGLYGITDTVEMNFVPFVTAFTEEALETMADEIKAFYRAYNRAVDFLNTSELDDYFHIMVDVIGFPADVAEHLVLPTFTHNQMPADHVLEAAIEWLGNRSLISEKMLPEDLINTISAP